MNKIIVRKFTFKPRKKTILILELMEKSIRKSGLEKVDSKKWPCIAKASCAYRNRLEKYCSKIFLVKVYSQSKVRKP